MVGANMTCRPTDTPEHVDIPALREKYRRERDKRLNVGGESQYVPVAGDLQDFYATDPHQPVAPREPIAEELDVAILGGGFGGILAAYHLTTGDVIHVSAGTYPLSTNVVITADDAGVTIQGPSGAEVSKFLPGPSAYSNPPSGWGTA